MMWGPSRWCGDDVGATGTMWGQRPCCPQWRQWKNHSHEDHMGTMGTFWGLWGQCGDNGNDVGMMGTT